MLYHRHIIDDDYYDDKIIGIYSSYYNARKTIKFYSGLPGFSDSPDGFHIEPFYISLPKKSRSGSKIFLYILIEEKVFEDYELSEAYIVYSSRIKAVWSKLVKTILLRSFGDFRLSIDKYYVDEDNWREGFVTID